VYDITPILTVFFPRKNTSGSALLQQVEAQLTCLKGVGDLSAPNATSDDRRNLPNNEAMTVGTHKKVMIGLVMAGAFWTLF
jgi:hypothetical protein